MLLGSSYSFFSSCIDDAENWSSHGLPLLSSLIASGSETCVEFQYITLQRWSNYYNSSKRLY